MGFAVMSYANDTNAVLNNPNLNECGLNNLNIKVKIGSVLFNIILGSGFFKLSDSFHVENHNHSAYEIHFILKGSGSIEISDKTWNISPNSYYIVGPSIYHEQKVNALNPISKYSFRIDYSILNTAEDFFPAEEGIKIVEAFKNVMFYTAEDNHNNLSLIYEVCNELQNQWVGYYSRIQSIFVQLIINIVRDIASKQKAGYKIPERFSDEKRNLIIEDFFEYNYNSCATADTLSKLLHVSIRQLNRIMKDSFHTTFKQKILEKRMEVSKSLLKNTDMPVKSISQRVGYDAESNFCIIFKQKNGYTPSEYRRNYNEERQVSSPIKGL